MLKRFITKEAKADMANIRMFTRQNWGEEQSIRYLNEINDKIVLLSQMPALGIDHSKEYGYDVHSCFVASHAIYYQYDESTLVIRAVLHQSRIPKTHLQQRTK